MKKYLILSALFILFQSVICFAVPHTIRYSKNLAQHDSLTEYTGKYQMMQGQQMAYADVYVVNGKLTAKSSNRELLTLDHISGDDFVVAQQGTPIKFIRDGANKVTKVSVMGNIAWTRVIGNTPNINVAQPPSLTDYLGKYQITVNGQNLSLEVAIKDGQLWCTQLWDGANSALDYISGDDFTVRALSMPLKFKRNKDNKVAQLLLRGTDLFMKVKN